MATKKKASSKKRTASPAKGVRASKRLQVHAPVSRPPLSAIISQQGSVLLSLPREIRDQIYMKVLEGLPLKFRKDKLIIIAMQSPGTFAIHPWAVSRGLPLWILSSQQILQGVLDMIARTFTFQPYGRPVALERPFAGVPNSLVFTDDSVRSLSMYLIFRDYRYSYKWESLGPVIRNTSVTGDQTVPFLKLMDSIHFRNGCLKLSWERYTRQREWAPGEPTVFVREWSEEWRGRFRKVIITVNPISDPEEGGASLWIMDEAEKCAVMLVGAGGSVSWEDEGRFNPRARNTRGRMLMRRVTVERKV